MKTISDLLDSFKKELGTQSYINKVQMMMAIEVIRDRLCGEDSEEDYNKATEIRETLHGEKK